jgi:hypothetical protein
MDSALVIRARSVLLLDARALLGDSGARNADRRGREQEWNFRGRSGNEPVRLPINRRINNLF